MARTPHQEASAGVGSEAVTRTAPGKISWERPRRLKIRDVSLMHGGPVGEGTIAPALEPSDDATSSVERGRLVRAALDRALNLNGAMVRKNIARARQRRPDASPAQVTKTLERMYLSALTGQGAAVGATAAAPGVGTGVVLALVGGEVLSALELTTLFALSLAEIHGIPMDEIERRRTLVMGIMLGSSGASTIPKVAERTGQHWAREIVAKVPRSTLVQVNHVLGQNFVTKYGTKQGIIILGQVVPFGFGAVIGGGGNALLAWSAILAARRAFGEAPATWPERLQPANPASVRSRDRLPKEYAGLGRTAPQAPPHMP